MPYYHLNSSTALAATVKKVSAYMLTEFINIFESMIPENPIEKWYSNDWNHCWDGALLRKNYALDVIADIQNLSESIKVDDKDDVLKFHLWLGSNDKTPKAF